MMPRLQVLGCLVVVACKSPGPAPAAPIVESWGSIPGLMWITDPQPWRLPHPPRCVAAGGDVALVGSAAGWLTWVDLRFGTVVRDRRVGSPTMTVDAIARLGYQRWLVVGMDGPPEHETVVAFVLDDDTLEATPIALGVKPDPTLAVPQIAMVEGSGVVITGRGLPLAIYDPESWVARTIIDPALGWGRVTVRGGSVVAERGRRVYRFDLTSHDRGEIASALESTDVALGEAVVATRSSEDGGKIWFARLQGKTTVRLPDPIEAIAIDPTGTQLVTAVAGQLRVHALPSGAIGKRIDLGDRDTARRIVFAEGRALVFTSGVLRVVDVDAGTVTPVGAPPLRVGALAVTGTGTVVAFGAAIWQIESGKLVASEQLGDARVQATRADDIRRYATTRGDATAIELRMFRGGRRASWILPAEADGRWLAADGSMVFAVAGPELDGLLRTRGHELVRVLDRGPGSEILDVDPDGDVLVALAGRVAVADARDGKPRPGSLTVPACGRAGASGTIDTTGKRAATYSSDEVAVWDRTTGKLVAGARLDGVVRAVRFVPKSRDLLLVFDDRLVLWTPGASTRTLRLSGALVAAMSSDGRGLALALHDGRVAFIDIQLLRDSLRVEPDLASAAIPTACGTRDPLAPDPAPDHDAAATP